MSVVDVTFGDNFNASVCFDGVHVEGGGVTDYNELENKPSINGVTLEGDTTLETLGAASTEDLQAEAQARVDGDEQLEAAIGALSGRVDTVEETARSASTGLAALSETVENLSEDVAGQDTRLDAAESAISTLQSDVATIGAGLAGLDSDVRTLSETVADVADSIPTKTSHLTNDSGYQTANDVENTLNTRLQPLETQVTQNTSDIETLHANIAALVPLTEQEIIEAMPLD